MDSLRRVSLPLKGTDRLRRALFRPRPARMGRSERKLEAALNQLRSGVPLNWTQIEDDPELVTLARVYEVAQQARGYAQEPVPPNLRAETLDRISKRLPKPKPQQVKQAPKSLAGFSENVPVLTQAEDDLPGLETKAPQMVAAVFITIVLVTGLAFAYNYFFPVPKNPYTWIEVRQNGSITQRPNLPTGYKRPNCPATTITTTLPYATRRYMSFTERQKAQENVDFEIAFMPDSLQVGGTTYGISLVESAVAPCDEIGATSFSYARMSYLVRSTTPAGDFKLAQLNVFQGRQQPVAVDNGAGTLKPVTIGQRHGFYWVGEPYRDYSNVLWLGQGPISVLVLEIDDIVTTFVGQQENGVTEEMLTALALKITGDDVSGTQRATPNGTPALHLRTTFGPNPDKPVSK